MEAPRDRWPRAFQWAAFLALPALVWPALAWLHREPAVAGALTVRTATFVAGVSAEPPASATRGELRALPDDWRARPAGVRDGWYRAEVELAATGGEEWAVYLPSVAMNAAVVVNGEPIGDGGELAEPVARNWRRPLLFPLPAGLLRVGPNVIAVRVAADRADGGLLGPIVLGPRHVVEPLWTRRHALVRDAVWIITLCLVIAGAFTGAVWVQWRDPSYLWFTAAAFAWAAVHLNLLVVDPPVTSAAWRMLWYLALLAWVVTLTRFLLAFVDAPAAGLRRALGLTVVACAAHDALVFLGLAGPTYDSFLPYAAPPVFVGMGWTLLSRFGGALDETAALVADLESRVDEKRVELARTYERLQDVERARVLAEERERIMREMHDGLGSHLVSTLALLEGASPRRDGASRVAVADAIRAALDDLRLMIDALVPLDGDLLGALAMLRARMQPRLEAAGIRVEWRVADLPRVSHLDAPDVLQVLRIVQEAFANVLKHAEARTLVVRTAMDGGARPAVAVEIADDGRGFDAGTVAGRGLQHMRQRAAAIGATLEIAAAAPGTRVRLHLPLATGVS